MDDDDEAAALAYQEQCEAQQFFNDEVKKVETLDDETPTAETKIHEIRVFRRC